MTSVPERPMPTMEMLIDRAIPEFDATLTEERVVAAEPVIVFAAALDTDLGEALRANRPEQVPVVARLEELTTSGTWVILGIDRVREIAFGAVARFSSGKTSWETIASSGFAQFGRPGYTRVACNITLEPRGAGQTLLGCEMRAQATDDVSRRALRSNLRSGSPIVRDAMHSALEVIAERATSTSKRAP